MHADVRAPNKRALKERIKRVQHEAAALEGKALEPEPVPEKRIISVNNRHLDELIDEAWAAELSNPVGAESLFVRDGRLVRLGRGRMGVRIVEVSQAALLNRLVAIASWTRTRPKEDGEGFEVKASKPPRDILGMMLEAPHRDLPELEAVVSAPVFGASGMLVARPGYHREDRLWYAADGLRVEVPARPTPKDVAAARRLLDDELFVDFPFATPSDRTHAVGALLLPFVRRMVAGPTPLHLIEAATPGTGKSLLADAIGMVVTGANLKATVFESDEAEVRKKITTLLEGGDPIIYADNIRAGIDSAAWASALTASVWSDRRLGGNTTITAPNNATWIATANNPRVTTEIARRVARIRLVADTTDPEARTGFRHPHLLTWAREHRAELVRAVLVLVRAW